MQNLREVPLFITDWAKEYIEPCEFSEIVSIAHQMLDLKISDISAAEFIFKYFACSDKQVMATLLIREMTGVDLKSFEELQ